MRVTMIRAGILLRQKWKAKLKMSQYDPFDRRCNHGNWGK